MNLEIIIGLEIHVQLKTESKMFCRCSVHEKAVGPNTNICPVCMGHPGSLPVPNIQAVEWTILAGHALGCSITPHSKFDRKNYFYPDLPKAYQISQFDLPIAQHGKFSFVVPGAEREDVTVGITRIHLEEDAAKSFHGEDTKTYVDYNRGGTPLMEIVSEPDFKTPKEAKIFLQELRLLLRYLGVSDADMEKGNMRCDANISLREPGTDLNPKTEVKNMNSFKAVERALEYEIIRQTKVWKETGGPVDFSSTRGWNDSKQMTVGQREKENAGDYRYFPDPDLPTLELKELAEEIAKHIPELPAARRARFQNEFCLSGEQARQLCDDPKLADYTEGVFSELHAWLESLALDEGLDDDACNLYKRKLGKLVSSWISSKLMGLMNEMNLSISDIKITQENFGEFITLLSSRKLTAQNGLVVLKTMLETGADPAHVMEEKEFGIMGDEDIIADAVDNVIKMNPDEVQRYKDGDKKLIKFFVGQIMKETRGNADPGVVNNLLKVKLEQ